MASVFWWIIEIIVVFPLCFASKNTSDDSQTEIKEKCYESLGCFSTGPPFYDPPHRSMVLLPFDAQKLQTKFILFTTSAPDDGRMLNYIGEELKNSSLDTQLPTKVIIPGYASYLNKRGLIYFMKNALMEYGNYNVILVDWSSGNRPPYVQAIANARVVAAQVSHFVGVLQPKYIFFPSELGVNLSTVHLIAHSLGAHLAGLAGKRLKGLGRISGLDPAGPYFYKADSRIRLSENDADFVDVIYTNAGSNYKQGLALNEAVGHINFYPNGGSKQPGCYILAEENDTIKFDLYANGCSHQRSLSLYTASINNSSCRFWGFQCLSFVHFSSGRCQRKGVNSTSSPPPVQMGFHATKPLVSSKRNKYFLKTEAALPYCLQKTNN